MSFYTVPTATGIPALAISTQSASFTAVANTYYNVSAPSSNTAITLPLSSTNQWIVIRKSDSTAYSVSMTGTINGVSTSLVIPAFNQTRQLYADGSGGWNVLGGEGYVAAMSGTNIKLSVGTTAPTSPLAGDIWIDTN